MDRAKGKRLDQYWTPPALARAVVEWADIAPGDRVLEPSCGGGDLVRWMFEGARAPGEVTALDVDEEVFTRWPAELAKRVSWRAADFLAYRAPSDAFDLAVMNSAYGTVGRGKMAAAADRLHVQHALRMCPDVVAIVRANFLHGRERYRHVFARARMVRLAILVNRPPFHGPALAAGQDSARHDYVVLHLQRERRLVTPGKVVVHDKPAVEWWTQDWRAPA